jgi:hypothetical protein
MQLENNPQLLGRLLAIILLYQVVMMVRLEHGIFVLSNALLTLLHTEESLMKEF